MISTGRLHNDSTSRYDLLVVGAGVVGLGHAIAAAARGLRVAVIERNPRAVGASVRNFGHGCVTGQSGQALDYALAARLEWLRLGRTLDLGLREAGTVVVARADDEYEVLRDLRTERGDDVVLLDAQGVRARVPLADESVVGGAWLPMDLRLDPRVACAAIAAHLSEHGVVFHWGTSVLGIEGDLVRTSRGDLWADRAVIAVGHDVDRLYPDIAAGHGLRRCSLHMLQLADPVGADIAPAVLTGWSLLRYDGFAGSPALEDVRARLSAADPGSVEAGLNLMFTQRPEGDVVFGDTHDYGDVVEPFRDEARDELLLRHARRLFGTEPVISQRWRGVYASAPTPFLVAAPTPQLRVVSVTTGIGMTTGFGLAQRVVQELLR